MPARYRDFSHSFWILLVGVFFMRMGQFMILPFLSIVLTLQFHTGPVLAGIILGAGWIAFAFASFNCGYWVDRYGAKEVILISLIIGALSFIAIFFYQSVFAYLILSIVLGLCRSAFNAASRAYIYLVTKPEQHVLAFGANYIAINAGFGIGLFMGAIFAASQSMQLFLWLAICYGIVFILLFYYLPRTKVLSASINAIKITLSNTMLTIIHDHKLLLLLAAVFFTWVLYVQTDSTLPIYLIHEFTNGTVLYAEIIAINALVAVFLQPVVSNVMKYLSFTKQVWLGSFFFFIGFLGYVFWNDLFFFMLGMGLLTLGELIIFPACDVWIGQMATPERAGAYYAAGNFTMLGNGIGPIVGGMLYEIIGIHTLFALCALISLFLIPLYISSLPKK